MTERLFSFVASSGASTAPDIAEPCGKRECAAKIAEIELAGSSVSPLVAIATQPHAPGGQSFGRIAESSFKIFSN